MGLPRENRLTKLAAENRTKMTYPEQKLWYSFLAEYEIPFRAQKVIGPFIVDFFCNKVRISIEVDGESHYTNNNIQYDYYRTQYLELLEVKELRFTNREVVEEFDAVCEVIHLEVQARRNDLVRLPLKLLRS